MSDGRKPDDPVAGEAARPEAVRAEGSGSVAAGTPLPPGTADEDRDDERPERDRGITDFVRRAVSAGVGAASRSKDDIMRVAANEMRTWLDHLDVNNELIKALSKMVIEVKTEIRFRPTEDGKIAPEASNDVKIKGPPRQG
jgi:hypothetical protein